MSLQEDGSRERQTPGLPAIRRKITFWLSLLTVGLVLLFVSGPTGSAFLSPGELTFGHGASAGTCADCHTAAHGSLVDWVSALAVSETGQENSKRCLACHDLGEQAFEAHNRPSKELAAVTERLDRMSASPDVPWLRTVSSWVPGLGQSGGSELACAICHKEHQGRTFDLTAMDQQQCQTCHARAFSSLADGHPPFAAYPYKRRTRIAFDHNSHIGKHFLGEYKEEAPATCIACHEPDAAGHTMQTGNFEDTCAGCHARQIKGVGRAEAKGLAVVRLPGVDLDTLHEHGISIGEWPADGNIEEGLTPFMALLLAGDPAVTEDLAFLAGFDDFADLSDATDEEITGVGKIVWAVKRLLYHLMTRGQQEMLDRLQATAEPGTRELAKLVGQLPAEVIRAAQQEWLPRLMTEVPAYEAGKTVVRPEDRASDEETFMDREREEQVVTGGWYRQDADFVLLYRPAGHADPFLCAWLEFTARVSGKVPGRSATTIFTHLSDPKAPGLCMKCHSVDIQADQRKRIHWLAARPVPHERRVTRFAHAVHFSLLDDKGCLSCHRLNPDAEVMDAFEDTDPLTFAGNFHAMKKTACVTCHNPERAGDTCLTCHNYHVGTVMPVLSNAPLTVSSP